MRSHRRNRPEKFGGDPWLAPYANAIAARAGRYRSAVERLTGGRMSLADFASGHEYFGLHCRPDGWVARELAPNATEVWLVGDFNGWSEREDYRFRRLAGGVWELELPPGAVKHLDHYLLKVKWAGGGGTRVPAFCRYSVQDEATKLFSAVVWAPETPYAFRNPPPGWSAADGVFVYEAHVGMAMEDPVVGTFNEFTSKVLPRVKRAGYNTLELMAVMNHPYYGSFGYHVANFFSIASRFGTPDDLKKLVDTAHGMGLRVIMDLVHSHAVKNVAEGIALQDGDRSLYFHAGSRGEHPAWDSLCFNYGKTEVLHFLLSNCRFWLDEYHLDGFRFDGVTSMLYLDHGLGRAFTGYGDYFGANVDEDAFTYLALASTVIHQVEPSALTVAEDVSGMPGLCGDSEAGGCGFDFRLAMGVTDFWFKLFDLPDESWNMWSLWHELTNRRSDERTVSYVECHDQAIVGGQTAIFRLIGREMYENMNVFTRTLAVDRGLALHKLARLITAASAGNGYLNFMGNEFGHPEWIDFPREGNNWSNHYARRQWSLAESEILRYRQLGEFDRRMVELLKGAEVYQTMPQVITIDDEKKLIAFERGGLWFFFNFNCNNSFADMPFQVLKGEYEIALESDAERFGGFGRIAAGQKFVTLSETNGCERVDKLRLYLPARTAIVLRKVK